MKNLIFVIVVLVSLIFLPLGSMADETVHKIPNYNEQQKSNGPKTIIIDDTVDTDLDPIRRDIVKRDTIISNVPTGAINSGSATGQ